MLHRHHHCSGALVFLLASKISTSYQVNALVFIEIKISVNIIIMDQWLSRAGSSRNNSTGDTAESGEPVLKEMKTEKVKNRQFGEHYVLSGFTVTTTEPPQSMCFICGDVLSNNSMKPSHLHRHLSTRHPACVGKPAEFSTKSWLNLREAKKN